MSRFPVVLIYRGEDYRLFRISVLRRSYASHASFDPCSNRKNVMNVNIEPMPLDRQRLADGGMTDEERALRKQWVEV